jgi:hypothetical protein
MKTWEKPRLIVLVRGKPEEALITCCKGTGTGEPATTESSCDLFTSATQPVECMECSLPSMS